jgi:hypothetical protein
MDAQKETVDTPRREQWSKGLRCLGANYVWGRRGEPATAVEDSRREQLWQKSTGNVNETFKDTLGLEIAKRITGTSIRLPEMNPRTLWRGRPPLKQRKRCHTE